MMYSRKLTEHCKPAIMAKKFILKINKKGIAQKLLETTKGKKHSTQFYKASITLIAKQRYKKKKPAIRILHAHN